MALISLLSLALAASCPDDEILVKGKCIKKTCVGPNKLECMGYGKCTNGMCLCDDGFVLQGTYKCTPIKCIVDGDVCPNGLCQMDEAQGWYCACNDGFTPFSGMCVPNECVTGTFESGDPEICHTRGTCDTKRKACQCSYAYTGFHCTHCSEFAEELTPGVCTPYTCVHEDQNGVHSLCGGHGTCSRYDYSPVPGEFIYICECAAGYASLYGDSCVSTRCINPKFSTKECSGHGDCVNDKCECIAEYTGKYCEVKR